RAPSTIRRVSACLTPILRPRSFDWAATKKPERSRNTCWRSNPPSRSAVSRPPYTSPQRTFSFRNRGPKRDCLSILPRRPLRGRRELPPPGERLVVQVGDALGQQVRGLCGGRRQAAGVDHHARMREPGAAVQLFVVVPDQVEVFADLHHQGRGGPPAPPVLKC